MQKTLIIKLSIIAGLCLMFGFGLKMIQSLIYERQHYSETVVAEIAEQHINPQQVITPFIVVPTTLTPDCSPQLLANKKCPKSYATIETFFADQTLSTQDLAVSTDTYKRGIYHATSYSGHLDFEQTYSLVKPNQYNQDSKNPSQDVSINSDEITKTTHWQDARLIIPVSDLRGVTTLPTVTFDKKNGKQNVKSTYPQSSLLNDLNYVEVQIPDNLLNQLKSHSLKTVSNIDHNVPNVNANNTVSTQSQDSNKSQNEAPIKLSVSLPLSGISTLSTVPTGQNFELVMKSNWHAPNFFGKALPNAKTYSSEGFEANWQNQYLTISNNEQISECLIMPDNKCLIQNNAPYNLMDTDYSEVIERQSASNGDITLSGFGVNFAEPNDVYLQTERTLKYALLLILISFGTFFLFEIIKSSRIHPIQYLLVGSALLVFYVLLLPLAEQISFWKAYSIAGTACVGLIGWYSYYLLGSTKRAILFTAILGALYASFYGILTSEDLNLLLGALFCFALLTSVMVLTRKIDWYKVA